MKTPYIAAVLTIFLSVNSFSKVEYYSCKEGVDKDWRFDLDAINQISPDAPPAVRMRQLGEVMEFSNLQVSDDWFKVIIRVGYVEQTFFISRTGKESIMKSNTILGLQQRSMGVCKNHIKGEDLDTYFKMQSELQQEQKDTEKTRLKNLPPSKNWN